MSYRASKLTAISGSAMIAAGFVVWVGGTAFHVARCGEYNDLQVNRCMNAGLQVGLLGLFPSIGGLVGMGYHDRPQEPQEPHALHLGDECARVEQARAAAAQVETRNRLLDLTKGARAAAYAHDCAAVKRRAGQVRNLDPEYYATVFSRDVVIRRCLEAALPAQPTPAEQAEGSP